MKSEILVEGNWGQGGKGHKGTKGTGGKRGTETKRKEGKGASMINLSFVGSQENNPPSSRQRSEGERYTVSQENKLLTSGEEGKGD